MPSRDSFGYELLSLTALCGELPCDSAARLIESESYRKKVITGLTQSHLIRIFSSRGLRGYRLGICGKRLLLQKESARFSFCLSGCNGTNVLKSEPFRRLRLHRIAQTYITMQNAGVTLFRDEKPALFSPDAKNVISVDDVFFYDSREMKEARTEMQKINGSRMVGALFTPNQVFAVYNTLDAMPTFGTQVEQRAKVMLQRVCQTRTLTSRKAEGILLANRMEILHTLLENVQSPSRVYFLFGESYEHFYFLTNDNRGEALLWMLCHPEITSQLDVLLLQGLQPPQTDTNFVCNAVAEDGTPVLFSYLPDLPTLYRFRSLLELHKRSGIIICFDFQAAALQPICGNRIEIQTIDYTVFEKRFLSTL